MSDATLIERIQKLLSRTTEAGCPAPEAETAFALAARLMAKHNIDMATVESHRGAEDTFGDATACEVARGSYLHEAALSVVRRYFFVEGYITRAYNPGRKAYDTHYVVFGTPSNTATATHVFRQFVAAGEHAWTEFKVRRRAATGVLPPRTAKLDFARGFASGVLRKLAAERQSIVAEEPTASGQTNGTALALVESRVRSRFEVAHPDVRKVTGSTRGVQSGEAMRAGQAAGAAFNPARPIGGARKAIGQS